MTQVLLWDTNVWSHLLLGKPEKRAEVQARLLAIEARHPDASRATSRICIAEALVAARRLADPQAAQVAEAALQAEFTNPNLIVVEITDLVAGSTVQIADLAATLRAEALIAAASRGGQAAGPDGGKLKLPDAIVAASCFSFSPPAVLVTENTSDFQQVENDGSIKRLRNLIVESI